MNIALTLINYGCDANKQTESMLRTPLHFAVLENHKQIVEMLLSVSVDPNVQDVDNCTPIHYACEFGHYEVVRSILSYEQKLINLSGKNNKGMTPVDCCRDLRILELIK